MIIITGGAGFIGSCIAKTIKSSLNEKIVIVSNDRDLTQLIAEDVIVYVQSMKRFINTKNHTEIMGYNYNNVVLKKVLCGDSSDNICSFISKNAHSSPVTEQYLCLLR